jgi:hypothetical protein
MKAGMGGTQNHDTLNHNRRRRQRSESREKEVLERQRPMTFDVAIEREVNGENELTEYENVSNVINIPSMGKIKLTYPDGETDMSPCGQIVSINEHKASDSGAN